MKLMGPIPPRRSLAERLYFGWIARLPCIVSGDQDVQVAHIRGADAWYAKGLPGMARKPSIPYVVPLSHRLHIEQEKANWRFWETHGFPREPAQASILFQCWWLWGLYRADANTSHSVAVLYLASLRTRGQE